MQITFNGGAKWEDLAKPEHYRHAVCNRCTAMHDPGKCQLHLHGPSSWHDGPGAEQQLPVLQTPEAPMTGRPPPQPILSAPKTKGRRLRHVRSLCTAMPKSLDWHIQGACRD